MKPWLVPVRHQCSATQRISHSEQYYFSEQKFFRNLVTKFLKHSFQHIWDFPGGSDNKAPAYNAGNLGSIPGSGRSPGEGNGNPLQYSCLENPMDGEAWWATVHRVLMVQISHLYMTTGKTIPLTRWTFVGKTMSLLFNMLSRLVIAFFQGASVF